MDFEELIRIMSFNIRYRNEWDDERNSWDNRMQKVTDMIRFHHTDIAGLQEVLIDQLNDIEKQLPCYQWVGVGRDDGAEEGEFAPIFFRRDIFSLLDNGFFWLSETPDIPGSIGWDAACIRITTWVKLLDRRTNTEFFVFNAHFDHVGKIAMEKSAYLLLDRIDKIAKKSPVIVTGDFNNTEDSEVYRILTAIGDARLVDSKYVSLYPHHGPNFTFHEFKALDILKSENEDLKQTIDFIFIKNNIKVLQHGTLSDTWDGIFPSDHMPVLADIKF